MFQPVFYPFSDTETLVIDLLLHNLSKMVMDNLFGAGR